MGSVPHAAANTRLRPALVNAPTVDWSKFLNRPLLRTLSCECNDFLAEKTVLVTGAGGSIGSVLAERLMGGLAGTLLLLDRSLSNLHALYSTYLRRNVTLPRVEFFHVNILHQAALQQIFSKYHPQVVFHAAAMKHVAELESDAFSALETNVLGTLRLAEMVDFSDVECFVNVSTDKAVNPSSVLGVSKRIAELLLLAIESGATRRSSLRLGNVLGSSGSVVPLLIQSLENGLPLRITHPQATRYFLSVEEAATCLMKSTEVVSGPLILPDMGSPRKITELADFVLRELRSDACAYARIFTGLRDGEKLSEQLTFDYEYLEDTNVRLMHKISGSTVLDSDEFADNLGRMLNLVQKRRKAGLIDLLLRMVPEFTPSPTFLSYAQ